MKTETIKLLITFTEPLLGTASANPDIQAEFIASKAPTTEAATQEVAAIPVAEEVRKATTIFPKDELGLFLWDYQVRGFLKEAIGVLAELGDAPGLSKWTFKRAVDALVFVTPRACRLLTAGGGHITKADGTEQRPIRCSTMQGDRVAMASSERIAAGCKCQFSICLITGGEKAKLKIDRSLLIQALDYGSLRGLGQWRNGSFGRFTWKEIQ